MPRFDRAARYIAVFIALSCSGASAQDLPTVYPGPTTPNAEFDAAPAIRVLPGGTVLEIGGSFSASVPQTFSEVLAQAPGARTIRFESPGGHVKDALAVAEIIRLHGLDTYVGRMCASACTLAFLAGRHRYLAEGARLGFHQAIVPGMPPERFDQTLRTAYIRFGVSARFIDHVLQTPPDSIWYPTLDELRDAGFVTDPPPASVAVADDTISAHWSESVKQLKWASDQTLSQFAAGLSALLAQLQAQAGDVCWEFMHGVPTDLTAVIASQTARAMTAALQQVRDDVSHAPAVGIDSAGRVRVLAELIRSLRPDQREDALDALKPNGAHEPYCRSIRLLLDAAVSQPPPVRGPALRALLSDE